MSKVEGQSDKLRIAFKLFDSEGAQFVNVIGEGTGALDDAARKAERFGNVLTATQQNGISKTAAKFVDFQSIMSGVFTQLTARGAPAFLKVAEKAEMLGVKMLRIINKYGPEIKVAFGTIADGANLVLDVVDRLLDDTGMLLKNLRAIGVLAPANAGEAGQGNRNAAQIGADDRAVKKAEQDQVKLQKQLNKTMDDVLQEHKKKARDQRDMHALSVKFLGHLH